MRRCVIEQESEIFTPEEATPNKIYVLKDNSNAYGLVVEQYNSGGLFQTVGFSRSTVGQKAGCWSYYSGKPLITIIREATLFSRGAFEFDTVQEMFAFLSEHLKK
jgi:hypothetical protein